MKPIKINDDILLIDNFYSKSDLKDIKKSVISERHKIVNDPRSMKNANYKRAYLDDLYKDRTDSMILTATDFTLFGKKTLSVYDKQNSYPFQTVRMTNNHETRLSVYPKGGIYPWHKDNVSGTRLLSFILPLDIVKPRKWTGGELVIKYKGKDIKIKPEDNQMIMFSSHLLHKVTPIKLKSDSLFDGRVVINGHIGFKYR